VRESSSGSGSGSSKGMKNEVSAAPPLSRTVVCGNGHSFCLSCNGEL
jgi:hypothetical protein